MFARNHIPPFGDGNCDGKTNFGLFDGIGGDDRSAYTYRGNARDYRIDGKLKERSIEAAIIRHAVYDIDVMLYYECVLCYESSRLIHQSSAGGSKFDYCTLNLIVSWL